MSRSPSNPAVDPPRAPAGPFPWRAMFISIVFVALAVISLAVKSYLMHRPQRVADPIVVRPAPNVVVAIHDLSRLETVSFHMERVVDMSHEQNQLLGLVTAQDSIVLVAAGDVIAGVDLTGISAADVITDWPHRRVHLRAPAPQIFSMVMDEQHTHVHSRTTDLLAGRDADLESRARRVAESAMRQGALDAGILQRAQRSTEQSLRSLLTALGFDQIDIEFRPAVAGPE